MSEDRATKAVRLMDDLERLWDVWCSEGMKPGLVMAAIGEIIADWYGYDADDATQDHE